MKNLRNISFSFLSLILIIIIGCDTTPRANGNNIDNENDEIILVADTNEIVTEKINKVTFYLENSESMFGYVNGPNEYINVVTELAEKPEFVEQKVLREFYFINGGTNIKINSIGSDPDALNVRLNKTGFNCGDITKSNLNEMFQIALDKADGENISILISDCIYDIGQTDSPFNSLVTEGRGTRSKFITRLGKGNIETIVIKLTSKFNGYYFYTSKSGSVQITQQRPFYVFIFGESVLLNKYFPEEYISKKLDGYINSARFFKSDDFSIPYQAATENMKGSFRFDKSDKKKLIYVVPGQHGLGFQFSIATDFSSLPFSEKYYQDINNYTISSNYTIENISKPTKKIFGLNFTPTYLITVHSAQSPYGELELSLENKTPSWITETNTDNENEIDTMHTFGFKYLTDAIIEAYEYKNQKDKIATFKFEIIK